MSEYYVVKDKPSKNPDGRWLSGPDTKWVEPIDVLKIPEVEGLTLVKDLNQQIKTQHQVILDDCETDKNIRELARPILGDFAVDGDSYGVPGIENIVEAIIAKLKNHRNLIIAVQTWAKTNGHQELERLCISRADGQT